MFSISKLLTKKAIIECLSLKQQNKTKQTKQNKKQFGIFKIKLIDKKPCLSHSNELLIILADWLLFTLNEKLMITQVKTDSSEK